MNFRQRKIMTNIIRLSVVFLLALQPIASAQDRLPLEGAWQFELDPDDVGIDQGWASRSLPYPIDLPGTIDLRGEGHSLDRNTMTYPVEFEYSKFPATQITSKADERGFLVRDHYYLGRAWYQKEITIPDTWSGKSIQLSLERVIWESQVWVDGRFSGRFDSLATAHRYELGILSPGNHRITICVDNRMIHNTGTIGHAYGPETQSRWNGIVGAIELSATDPVHLQTMQIFPAADREQVKLTAMVMNRTRKLWSGNLKLTVLDEETNESLGSTTLKVTTEPGEQRIEGVIPLSRVAESWDEFNTKRYTLRAELSGDDYEDVRSTRFGFRHIVRDGRAIRVNGRRIFLRGTLDCAVYPRTGHPPVTVDEWMRVLGIIKSHGFNHVRYHSWCPPEAAFEAADRLGLYIAPETVFWVDGWTTDTFSQPKPLGQDESVEAFVRQEIQRISEAYGNHPSFALFCIGNEFARKDTDWTRVDDLLNEAKQRDARRLYNASTARRRVPTDDFWVTHTTGTERTRGVGPPHTNWDFSAGALSVDLPLVAHETGQRPVFPDYETLLPKFDGPLRPLNYQRLKEKLAATPLLDQAADFKRASAKFQMVQYKAEHEAMLRTSDYSGYQLLMLNDFTGQSEALVGILDPFWESKGIVTREDVLEWNAPTVALARFSRYLWTTDEDFRATVEVAHYGPEDLIGEPATWSLTTATGRLVAEGQMNLIDIPAGRLTRLGEVKVSLKELKRATVLRFKIQMADTENRWSLWVYPPYGVEPQSGNVRISKRLDKKTQSALANGASVLLLPYGAEGSYTAKSEFLSVYWSAGWRDDAFSSLGVVCDPDHPALAEFPNSGHSDWQWYELTEGATTFLLDDTPEGFRPIVQPVTDFHQTRMLGQVFETRVGKGRLLVCGYDLDNNLQQRHAARQFRRSLIKYMQSERFEPDIDISVNQLLALFK